MVELEMRIYHNVLRKIEEIFELAKVQVTNLREMQRRQLVFDREPKPKAYSGMF